MVLLSGRIRGGVSESEFELHGSQLAEIALPASAVIRVLDPQDDLIGQFVACPSAVLQHDWREGDLVIWDNVALQHGRGIVTLDEPERTLRKVGGPITYEPGEIVLPSYSKVAKA